MIMTKKLPYMSTISSTYTYIYCMYICIYKNALLVHPFCDK